MMIDTQYLDKMIKISGKKKSYIAKKMGITPNSLSRKINNKNEFLVSEMAVLSREINLPNDVRDKIFLP